MVILVTLDPLPSTTTTTQGDLPSPTDSRFFSRLLSSDDLGDVLDADQYLRPDKEMEEKQEQRCCRSQQPGGYTVRLRPLRPAPSGPSPPSSPPLVPPQNGRPVRENSVALRYISDPTNNNLLEREACSHGTHW